MDNDLISRSALIQHAYSAVVDGVEKDIIDLSDVDNASTVEPDILYLCDHKKCGDDFNCYECNHTSDIRHAINFDLMEFPRSVFVERKRPQGEWIVTAEDSEGIHRIQCPFCKYEKGSDFIDYITVTFEKLPPFCENCGASMAKGEEE